MWVLSTDRAELHYFPHPEEVPDGYAALSHVWNIRPEDGPSEQSFQDVRKIQESCVTNRTNPRNFVGKKIRRCCELAESHGYRWVWIDTCCIDKTSSAELSEAINSMFRYYSLSRICNGYLRDVPDPSEGSHDCEREIPFMLSSEWFRRGWTLQELIAPRLFLLLSWSWHVLGSKVDFAGILECHIGIPAALLRLEVSHTAFSINQRMSWFGRRETTRLEDEAYCLQGLFDVHMPPLYGEGRNAFRRLQEEIMKQSSDTTLFVWSGNGLPNDVRTCLLSPSPSTHMSMNVSFTPPQSMQRPTRRKPNTFGHRRQRPKLVSEGMKFTLTPNGILAHIQIIAFDGRQHGDLYWSEIDGPCGKLQRILLCLEADPVNPTRPSSPYPSYRVSPRRTYKTEPPTAPGKYTIDGRSVTASWQTVLIKDRPSRQLLPGQLPVSSTHSPTFIPPVPRELVIDAPYRFDEARIHKFMRESQMARVQIRSAEFPEWAPGGVDSRFVTTYTFTRNALEYVWDPAHITSRESHSLSLSAIIIVVGQCRRQERPGGLSSSPGPKYPGHPAAPLRAYVHIVSEQADERCLQKTVTNLLDNLRHGCSRDHVVHWLALQKEFHFNLRSETPSLLGRRVKGRPRAVVFLFHGLSHQSAGDARSGRVAHDVHLQMIGSVRKGSAANR